MNTVFRILHDSLVTLGSSLRFRLHRVFLQLRHHLRFFFQFLFLLDTALALLLPGVIPGCLDYNPHGAGTLELEVETAFNAIPLRAEVSAASGAAFAGRVDGTHDCQVLL